MRQISSSWTFFNKFVFPAMWIGGFGIGTVVLLVTHQAMGLGFLAGLIVGTVFLFAVCMRIKSVVIDGNKLIISNFKREIEVPLSQVESVSATRFLSPEIIFVRFKVATPFGTEVMFNPPVRWFGSFSKHPLADELSQLAKRCARYSA